MQEATLECKKQHMIKDSSSSELGFLSQCIHFFFFFFFINITTDCMFQEVMRESQSHLLNSRRYLRELGVSQSLDSDCGTLLHIQHLMLGEDEKLRHAPIIVCGKDGCGKSTLLAQVSDTYIFFQLLNKKILKIFDFLLLFLQKRASDSV